MKSLFRILPLLSALFLFSCTKEEVTPTTPGGTSSVQVEYRVYAASADVTIYALLPVSGQAALAEEKVDHNRMTFTSSFEAVSGTQVSIRATNRNPGPEEITVEVYVNGRLAGSASATAPGQYAAVTTIAR
jgi:hypothetical protein